jgi:hypothetical protein
MGDNIEMNCFKKSDKKKLYRLTSNNNEIYIKIKNVSLPFNCQLYNNNLYINAEVLKNNIKNIDIITVFESYVIKKMNTDKKFISVIKNREESNHLKLMLKRNGKHVLLSTELYNITDDNSILNDIDIYKLSEYHKLNIIYDIVIKPEIVWETDTEYGIVYYLTIIKPL